MEIMIAMPNATATAIPAVDIPLVLVVCSLLLLVVVVVEFEDGDVDSGGNAEGAAGVTVSVESEAEVADAVEELDDPEELLVNVDRVVGLEEESSLEEATDVAVEDFVLPFACEVAEVRA